MWDGVRRVTLLVRLLLHWDCLCNGLWILVAILRLVHHMQYIFPVGYPVLEDLLLGPFWRKLIHQLGRGRLLESRHFFIAYSPSSIDVVRYEGAIHHETRLCQRCSQLWRVYSRSSDLVHLGGLNSHIHWNFRLAMGRLFRDRFNARTHDDLYDYEHCHSHLVLSDLVLRSFD
jgi:hypothetical protein